MSTCAACTCCPPTRSSGCGTVPRPWSACGSVTALSSTWSPTTCSSSPGFCCGPTVTSLSSCCRPWSCRPPTPTPSWPASPPAASRPDTPTTTVASPAPSGSCSGRSGELKPLLYTFRALLTGIHLMRTGDRGDLSVLVSELHGPSFLPELITAKAAGEHLTLSGGPSQELLWQTYERWLAELVTAQERSTLPEHPPRPTSTSSWSNSASTPEPRGGQPRSLSQGCSGWTRLIRSAQWWRPAASSQGRVATRSASSLAWLCLALNSSTSSGRR